jgi:hypothetical protein
MVNHAGPLQGVQGLLPGAMHANCNEVALSNSWAYSFSVVALH